MINTIIPSTYFGNIAYYALVVQKQVVVDVHEHYRKQTYRTRCDIYGANGLLSLSVPIVRPHNQKTKMEDIAIRYDESWQKIHWRSITSAYRSSPYFEFYEDIIAPIFETKFSTLHELNVATHKFICDALGVKDNVTYSNEYVEEGLDFRAEFKPSKKNVVRENLPRYFQVFEDKDGFIANLSMLDLLFNQGPASLSYLQNVSLDKIFSNYNQINS